MSKSVHLKNGTILRLQDKAFANGGEAELFKIISPKHLKDQVVKKYKQKLYRLLRVRQTLNVH